MASGSDVRDILGLAAASSNLSRPTAPKKLARPPGQKRLAGIARELHDLLGGSAPPIVPVRPQYKAKPKMSKRVTAWVWRQFRNEARNDELLLEHWEKATDSQDEPYRFSKFNKGVHILEYTDDEYNKYLADPAWSRQETDYLWKLIRRFEWRFVIITDRYEWPDKERSMEDLKDRYYSIVRKLAEVRSEAYPELREMITTHKYDKNIEVERKKHLDKLYGRTAEQIKEEEILFYELKKREANEQKWTREREHLAKSLGSMDIPIPLQLGSNGSVPPDPRGFGMGSGLPTPTGRKDKGALPLGRSILGELEDTAAATRRVEKIPPGVFLRSSRLTQVKAIYQQKLNEIFERFEIPLRPQMATGPIVAKLEELKALVQQVFELKRMQDRMNMDMKSALQRKQFLEMGEYVDELGASGPGTRKRSLSSPANTPRDSKRQRS
ncbi:hypothetical protein SeLEV6574_g00819 [Synchytrium endobioticum]|uniref:SWR1-complex protein 4 n=1 Tax=Synchytrium endobioticum TaxID=286115 RepID=A0A507DGK3_9FUNG|nr:hypothetical protein SeLEV6574_g00819 [Synchytrium endobioticum]